MSTSQLKRDYLWNTLGSVANALSTVVLLFVVTRISGAYQGGIFAIALAIAQQFQTLGQFEVRPFQATDIHEHFKFGIYLSTRIVTCGLMIVAVCGYAVYSNGIGLESLTIVFLALLRFFDAFEDVFHGMFQQRGRLDIAGKALFFRIIVTVVSFSAGLAVTSNLIAATIISFMVSTVAFLVLNWQPAREFVAIKPIWSIRAIRRLLLDCMPLFLGSFFLAYLANAPKFALEEQMSKDFQTYYAVLFMPAMVVNLLSGFVFKPLLTTFAAYWEDRNLGAFFGITAKGLGLCVVATLVTELCALLFGIPVLSFIYGVDLESYKSVMLLLILGGGLNAVSIVLYYALVTMRRQKTVLVGYVLSAACAAVMASPLVAALGIFGAALTYMFTITALVLIFTVEFVRYAYREKKKIVDNS